eukprot:CAMPEP_0118631984 /NCGR_PEP_ID=MMETSP0785-20121206/197_1 /TAXON_ID=91992 /ORGANISM="Bolidomonas pacifica, Strain CCMP 1866" /LENGTH=152 /DNA_ID=CAMNT_0006522713 /DNA_START=306 /DNA_END=761 /DNA_ORIENTATION=-
MVSVVGIAVCCGWYASLLYEYLSHGRFFKILYDNAEFLFESFEETSTCSKDCVLWKKIITHAVDIAAHPLPLIILLRSFPSIELQEFNEVGSTIAAFIMSRMWSIFHNIFNMGWKGHSFLFYCERHIYNLEGLDAWKYAYIAEGTVFAALTW